MTNRATKPSKSRAHILAHYFTGGNGREFDTYRNPELYDRGSHSRLYRRGNLARGVADVVEQHLSNERPAHILDVGAGTGILTLELARRGHVVTGVDLFAEQLGRLKFKAEMLGRTAQIQTVQCDMNEGLPFRDEQFSTVVSLRATRYIRSFTRWLNEVERVLEPGGGFILPAFAVDAIPWRRHSELGWRQPTSANSMMGTVEDAGLSVDQGASGKYGHIVDQSLGERDVPFYYSPTFIVAEKPPQQP